MATFRPGKPRCSLSLSTDALQVTNGTAVPFDQVYEDPAGQGSGSTITIDRDGFYEVCYGVGRTAAATPGIMQAQVLRNGTQVIQGHTNNGSSAAACSGSRLLELVANDALQLTASLGTSGTQHFKALVTYLDITRVGPVRWT